MGEISQVWFHIAELRVVKYERRSVFAAFIVSGFKLCHIEGYRSTSRSKVTGLQLNATGDLKHHESQTARSGLRRTTMEPCHVDSKWEDIETDLKVPWK